MDIYHDISLGLVYLHRRCGIIHRDLDSGNILLVAGRRAKIFNFGLAKIPVPDSVRHAAFDPATGPFLPPESLTGSYSYKFDCFSLGVIAIQICTLQMPEPTPPYVVLTAGKHESS